MMFIRGELNWQRELKEKQYGISSTNLALYAPVNGMQGVVTAMCSVLPAATAIKVKSRDQAHR